MDDARLFLWKENVVLEPPVAVAWPIDAKPVFVVPAGMDEGYQRFLEELARQDAAADGDPWPFTIHQEANAITCDALRRGYLEVLHEGERSGYDDLPGILRATPAELERLLSETTSKMQNLLEMRRISPGRYRRWTGWNVRMTARWVQDEPIAGSTNRMQAELLLEKSAEDQAGILVRSAFESPVRRLLGQGRETDLLTRPELSRFDNRLMAELMIECSAGLAELLPLLPRP